MSPPPVLDPDQQVLAQQEFAYVSNFAYAGHPTTPNTPTWPRFNKTRDIMSLPRAVTPSPCRKRVI